MSGKIRVSVIGVTGYTGLELLRLLPGHPDVTIAHLVARQEAGQNMAAIAPHLAGIIDHVTEAMEPEDVARDSDVVFLALPHTVSQDVAAKIAGKTKIIDIGADFRLPDPAVYERYYGSPHRCPELLSQFVYGMPELYREEIKKAEMVANPGCYALLIQLMLLPFRGNIAKVRVMAVTGSSGFGKTANELSHHPAYNNNMQSYKINAHRHTPEIIRSAQIDESQLDIVPTLGPFTRGIFATAFIDLVQQSDVEAAARGCFDGHPFTRLSDHVTVANIAASNFCDLNYRAGRAGDVLVQGALDNLTRGSSGNALQCMNLMFGLDERTGLNVFAPVYP